MPVSITYALPATSCPPPIAPADPQSVASGTPTPRTYAAFTPGATIGNAAMLNANAVRAEAAGDFGGGGAGILHGLEVSDNGDGTVAITAGSAMVSGGLQTPVAVASRAVTNNAYTWLWVVAGSAIQEASNAAAPPQPPPATQAAFLCRVQKSAGSIVGIDYSGRGVRVPNLGWLRRTADAGQPLDTPPAGVAFWTRTLGGLYLWDGAQYTAASGASGFPYNIPAGVTVHIPAGYQQIVFGDLTVAGRLTIDGKLRVTP